MTVTEPATVLCNSRAALLSRRDVEGVTFVQAVISTAGGLGDVCPVLLEFGCSWCDGMRSDTERCQRLCYVRRLEGTKGTEPVEAARRVMVSRWLITEHTAAWLDLAGYGDHAQTIRSMQEIDYDVLRAVDDATSEAARSADNAAQKAAYASGWLIGRGHAATDAADWVAWNAVRVAAANASWAKVPDSDWGELRREMIFDALEPTVSTLQASAHGLFGQMIRQGESG